MSKDLQFRSRMMAGGFSPMPKVVLKSPKLSMQAKTLYCQLTDYAWQGEAYPGRDRLAKENGVHVNSVDKYMNELKEAGLVSVERRGQNLTNLYTLEDLTDVLVVFLEPYTGPNDVIVNPDSHPFVTPDSHPAVTPDSHPFVVKEQAVLKTNSMNNKGEICAGGAGVQRTLVPMPPAATAKQTRAGKAATGGAAGRGGQAELAEGRVEAARASGDWSQVTDRDFTFYYLQRHNELMPKPLTLDRYSSVTVMRENFINANELPRERVCEYIDMVLELYTKQPDKWDSLTFGMIQKNGKLMYQLMELAHRKLRPPEKRFTPNQPVADLPTRTRDTDEVF